MPKLNHLRSFVIVAETGSISIAAQKLHRSPSAISMTLSNLETEFGRKLFEAEGKSRLTPFGSYVYEIAGEQIKRFDKAIDSIETYARNDYGSLDIAAVPSFATRYLPALLGEFVQRHPLISLSIRDDSSHQVNKLVDSGDIDVGIASLRGDFPAVSCQPLLTDPIGVVCGRSHALANLGRPLVWQDLSGEAFIANGTCHYIKDDDFQKIVENAEIDVQNTTSLLALVAAGAGVTTLPRLAVPAGREDVVFLTPVIRDYRVPLVSSHRLIAAFLQPRLLLSNSSSLAWIRC